MAALTSRVRGGGERVLWLDYADYAGRLLAGGAPPWLDTAALVAWQRKAQGLLHSDVLAFPVGRAVAAWLAGHPDLGAAMAARSRAVYPLKTLLADEALRSALLESVRALRAGLGNTLLMLSLPSPRAWVVEAYRQAHASAVEAGEDEADSAALYMADFLRSYGEAGIDGIELVETADTEPSTVGETACYQAVRNVAGHYRWDVGLHVPGLRFHGPAGEFDFVTSPAAVSGTVHGQRVPAGFWQGDPAPAVTAESFWQASIPADGQPEQVLERIAQLR